MKSKREINFQSDIQENKDWNKMKKHFWREN